jgi:general secretion pathway protein C
MASRAFAFVIWAAVAASVVFWMLRLAGGSRPVPAHAVAVGENTYARGDLSRLFGREAGPAAIAAPTPVSGSPLKLIGVVAPREGSGLRAGVALISIEGKPARPFRVGSAVDSDLVLLGVHQRGASLGPRDGDATLKLELPPLPPPATATLPPAGSLPSEAASPRTAPIALPRMRLPPPMQSRQQTPEESDAAVDADPDPPEPPQRQPEPGDRPVQ